jgi:hypothetical protein
MTNLNRETPLLELGKASRATRGAGGHMLEAGGLWTKTGITRGR